MGSGSCCCLGGNGDDDGGGGDSSGGLDPKGFLLAMMIALVLFMIPLPYQVESGLIRPLQRLATVASAYALQTFGLPAVAEGNVILLNQVEIGVVEACSGLSMMYTFFALAAGMALLVRRPWLDKLVVVLAAVPISLIANMGRITLTGVLHETTSSRVANAFYHDLAGWLMMPFALVMLQLVLWLFDRLLVEQAVAPAGPIAPLLAGVAPQSSGAAARGPAGRGRARRAHR